MSRIKRYIEDQKEAATELSTELPAYIAAEQLAEKEAFLTEVHQEEEMLFLENFNNNMSEMAEHFGEEDEFDPNNPFQDMMKSNRNYRDMSRGW